MDPTQEDLVDDLLELTEALKEHLRWSQQLGTWGLSASPNRVEIVKEPPRQRTAVSRNHQATRTPNDPRTTPRPADRGRDQNAASSRTRARTASAGTVWKYRDLTAQQRADRLRQLEQRAKQCQSCPLHRERHHVVFGQGRPLVELMIVGEGPGRDEDLQGVPFVGKSGQLLDRMLAAIGFSRQDVYIANIVKCRPPNNRTPQGEEMRLCSPFLAEQISLVQPRLILSMGATALYGLTGMKGIRAARGKWKMYRSEVLIMPTYHPAYLLRNESAKGEVWRDLKAVVNRLGRKLPGHER